MSDSSTNTLSEIGKSLRAHPDYSHFLSVSNTLMQNGFKAYIAGGAVRDLLIGRQPKDFDFATNATPEQIEALFEKTIPVGKKFGIIVVVVGSLSVEVATFRRDGEYVDGRRPESIQIASPEEDARRRDFTVNSLFYDFQTDQVIDYVGGLQDLKNRVLKTVGLPEIRFQEDYLRILRLLRLAVELDFQIDPSSLNVACGLMNQILKVSYERIHVEFIKALASAYPERAFDLFSQAGLFSTLFPQMDWSEASIRSHFIQMRSLDRDEETIWLGLFSGQAQINLEKELKNMKCSRSVIDHVLGIVKFWKDWNSQAAPRRLSEWIARSFSLDRKKLLHLGKINQWISVPEISEFNSWLELPDRLLSGDDFLQNGFQGAQISVLAKELVCLQIEEVISSREEALEWLQKKRPLS